MLVGDNIKNEIILIISLSILIKIGITPFHTWVILIIERINFFSIIILLTVIKIQPIFIIYQINTKFILIPAFIGIIIRALICLNQSSIRKTIGYSSIFNIRLIILTINKVNIFCIYIIIYSITLLMLIQTLKINKINFLNQIVFNEFRIWIKLNLWINIISIGGFPPLLGFIGKLLIIQILTINNQFLLILTLIISSIIVLLFYSRIVFTSMLTRFTAKKWLNSFNSNWYYIITLNFLITPIMISITRIL